MISALKGEGVDDIARLVRRADAAKATGSIRKTRPPIFPRACWPAEITREKLYLRLHDELPYATRSRPRSRDRDGRTVRSDRPDIYVERDGQKAIVLGKGGRR